MIKKRKLIFKILGIGLILFVVIFFIINTIIANSVIQSMSDVRVEKNNYTLSDFGLVGHQIQVKSKDGLNINAYVVNHEDSKGNVIILHGMHGMDATSLFDYAKFIYDAGFTAIVVDMRAHGKSDGNSLSFGYNETYDVLAIIDYLKTSEAHKDQPIILYGLSMGGSTAINVAAQSEDLAGVIAISPFLSYQNQVEDYMLRDGAPKAFVKVFMPSINLVLKTKFGVRPIKESPEQTIKQLSDLPILIVHGEKDSQTNVYHSRELFKQCSSNRKELWIVEGKDHLIEDDVLNENSDYYRNKITNFLNSIVN